MPACPCLVLEAAGIVGEGLVCDGRRDALSWVDICGRRLHRLALASSAHEVWRNNAQRQADPKTGGSLAA